MSSTYWQTQYQSARRKVQELEAERDALAAHVERLQAAGGELRATWDLSHLIGADTRRLVNDWDHVREEGPATSLARRDARVKAEAFVSFARRIAECNEPDDMESIEDIYDSLMRQAADYRQQAEGGGDE